MDDVFVLPPHADEETKAAFNATVVRMMCAWGNIMTRTAPNGEVSIILPPEFIALPEEPVDGRE